MKEAMVTSKLEVITLEYNHLLASQLDSQRQYFEGLLAQHDAKQQGALAAARAAAEAAQASSAAAAASAKESERKRQQLERKLVREWLCGCQGGDAFRTAWRQRGTHPPHASC
jgi:BRCA1-associated protein